VVHRPKGYFPVPALKYLQGSTLELIRDALTPEKVKQRELFDYAQVKKLIDAPHEHLTPSGGSKLWQIGLLECWLQQLNI
jgi:asparagine synthase (glutamine-hydrolysing)